MDKDKVKRSIDVLKKYVEMTYNQEGLKLSEAIECVLLDHENLQEKNQQLDYKYLKLKEDKYELENQINELFKSVREHEHELKNKK